MLDGRAEAFLYLDADRPATRRNADAPSFCHALARLGALALANLRRLAGERERAALAADLERAREVQHRLLPAPSGRLGGVDYALRLHPGRVVAGDIVDAFELEDGRVVAVLGDVSGAGLGAGLVMASVQSFLRAGFAHDDDPARVLRRLNRHLCAQASGGRFVTLWLGVFAADGAHCTFVDAGHGYALRLRNGVATELSMRGAIPWHRCRCRIHRRGIAARRQRDPAALQRWRDRTAARRRHAVRACRADRCAGRSA